MGAFSIPKRVQLFGWIIWNLERKTRGKKGFDQTLPGFMPI